MAEWPPVLSLIRKIGSFAVTVGLSTVVGAIAVPVLVTSVGAHGWASIALAQTVAQIVTIIVAFGWGLTGPSVVGVANAAERPRIYLQSLISRCYLFVLGYAISVAVLLLLLRGDLAFALLASAAYLAPALGASWYFIGSSKPWLLFACDAVPTMLGTLIGLFFATATRDVHLYLLWQLVGSAVAVVTDAVVVLRGAYGLRPDLRLSSTLRVLHSQRHAVATGLTAGLYVNLPILIIQTFIPVYLPTYVLADRLYKYAAVVLSPVQQFFQGWVPEAGSEFVPHRAKRAIGAATLFGILGGVAVACLSPLGSIILSDGKIVVPWTLSVPFGVAFLGVAISGIVGYACLAVIGRVRSLAASTFVGAVVGMPVAVACGVFGWPEGVAWAVAGSELVVALYQIAVVWRWRHHSSGSSTARASGLQR